MSVEVTNKHQQFIFSNIWDKGDQIFIKPILYILNHPLFSSACWYNCYDLFANKHFIIIISQSCFLYQRSYQSTSQQPISQHHKDLRPKLFPTWYILYSLFFPVISLTDAPLHLPSCTQHLSIFLPVNVATTSPPQRLMVSISKLSDLNFSSVSISLISGWRSGNDQDWQQPHWARNLHQWL